MKLKNVVMIKFMENLRKNSILSKKEQNLKTFFSLKSRRLESIKSIDKSCCYIPRLSLNKTSTVSG